MAWTVLRGRGNGLGRYNYRVGVRTSVDNILIRLEARHSVVSPSVIYCTPETNLDNDESWYNSLMESQSTYFEREMWESW